MEDERNLAGVEKGNGAFGLGERSLIVARAAEVLDIYGVEGIGMWLGMQHTCIYFGEDDRLTSMKTGGLSAYWISVRMPRRMGGEADIWGELAMGDG